MGLVVANFQPSGCGGLTAAPGVAVVAPKIRIAPPAATRVAGDLTIISGHCEMRLAGDGWAVVIANTRTARSLREEIG